MKICLCDDCETYVYATGWQITLRETRSDFYKTEALIIETVLQELSITHSSPKELVVLLKAGDIFPSMDRIYDRR